MFMLKMLNKLQLNNKNPLFMNAEIVEIYYIADKFCEEIEK
ncbi:hypothetical protein [Limibacterium fermenti]